MSQLLMTYSIFNDERSSQDRKKCGANLTAARRRKGVFRMNCRGKKNGHPKVPVRKPAVPGFSLTESYMR